MSAWSLRVAVLIWWSSVPTPLRTSRTQRRLTLCFWLAAASISEQGSACGLRSNKPMVAWTTFCSLLRLVGYVGELPDVLSPPLYAGASGEL